MQKVVDGQCEYSESIKQKIMLSYEPWEVGQIDEHGKEMTKILLQ